MSPQQRFTAVPSVAGVGSHARPPTAPGPLTPGRMSFDFARAPGEGRRVSMGGLPPSGSRSQSFDLGASPTLAPLQGLVPPEAGQQGAGQGGGADRPVSAQSA